MAGDSLAGSLGEVPAKDVAVIAKAASEEATKWLKRNNVEAGAGTLAYAGTLLKVSTSSDQRTRTGIFILIASGGTRSSAPEAGESRPLSSERGGGPEGTSRSK